MTVSLGLVEVGQNSLGVLLNNIFWDAFHAKDFNVEGLSVGKSVVNSCEVLFMDLTHVDAQT